MDAGACVFVAKTKSFSSSFCNPPSSSRGFIASDGDKRRQQLVLGGDCPDDPSIRKWQIRPLSRTTALRDHAGFALIEQQQRREKTFQRPIA